jgi:hypothetical protein
MRPCGAAKQRLWLGAGRYRGGCREPTTNSTTRNAYPYTYGDAMRAWNAYANPDGDSDRHANRNTNGYTYCNSYDDTNANTYAYCDTDGYSKGDAKASPDSASAADSVGGLGASLEML